MPNSFYPAQHLDEHAGASRRALLQPAAADLIRVGSRPWFVQCGLAGVAGLTAGEMLVRAEGAEAKRSRKAVILFWLSGGPSHLDFWDPKPDAPVEIRGPFDVLTGLAVIRSGSKGANM